MIFTVTLNPALDKTVEIPSFRPDAVNRITSVRTDIGGKGINVACAIQALGGNCAAAALLGGQNGRRIARELAKRGIPLLNEHTDGETRVNTKIVDPVNGTHTDLNEPGPNVKAETVKNLLQQLTERLQPGDQVILSGSAPRGVPEAIYRRWAAACKKAGARVLLDADGALLSLGLAARPDLIKPNQEELSRLCGAPLRTLDEIDAAAQKLQAGGVGTVVVSCGDRGALFRFPQSAWYAAGVEVPVGSTVGAGDSMLAALACAFERGLSEEETARLAVAAGAASVMQSGTQPPDPAEVERLLPRVQLQKR